MASDKFMITHYHNIMPMLKRIFYYGSYSKSDMEKAGDCGKSKYYSDATRIKYVFGDLLEERTNSAGEKAYSLRNNYFEDSQQHLMKFFALKSIDINKLIVSCYVLQTLYVKKQPLAFKDLKMKIMASPYILDENADPLFGESTLTNWVNDMVRSGILTKTGLKYTVADNLLCEAVMERRTRDHLLLLTDFCSNVLPLSVCGGGIRTKLDQKYRSLFLFKHRYPGQIFDDETIWKLLVYIENKQPITFRYKSTPYKAPFLPYRIITEKASGRQYLFAVCLGGKKPTDYILRIDKLSAIKTSDGDRIAIPQSAELEARYSEVLRRSFSGIYIPRNAKAHPVTGTLVFLNGETEKIRRRFPEAVITQKDDTQSSAEIEVYNMDELKPWLRTNISTICLISSSDGTADKLKQEWKEWRKMYGID